MTVPVNRHLPPAPFTVIGYPMHYAIAHLSIDPFHRSEE
jgi:hypothetical protein